MNIDSEAWRQVVITGAAELGVTVSAKQAQALSDHAGELIGWNRVTNLTAITDPLQVAVKHYIDALAPAALIPEGARMLDAGAGGGFPGLPIKVVRPDLSVTLVDSVRKKTSFINYAIGKLQLHDIRAVHARLEALADNPAYRGKFDLVICRAFSSLADFAALALPFLAAGGSLLAMKGPQAECDHDEGRIAADGILAVAETRLQIRIHRYALPFLGDRRQLVRLTPV